MPFRKILSISLTVLMAVAVGILVLIRPSFQTAGMATVSASTTASLVADDTKRTSGLDISHYQGDVDWSEIARGGINFVYAKATDGITYTDPKLARNIAGAEAANIPIGSYHFYEPMDDPIAQADHFIAQAAISTGNLPPAIDVERPPNSENTKFPADLLAFASRVEQQTGCRLIFYASRSFWNSFLSSGFEDYGLWLASYGSEPKLPDNRPTWTFWQHTQNGSANGISGPVDLDSFAGAPADLQKILCK